MLTVLEGMDGSGTSTVSRELHSRFDNSVLTAEPSDQEIGQLLQRRLADDTTDELANLYLFIADRIEHIDKELSLVDTSNSIVLCDRYIDSTRAYQPVALQNSDYFDGQWSPKMLIERLHNHIDKEPDLVLYLDVSVDTAIERSDGTDSYENREFLEQVKENYDAIEKSNEHVVRVNAERDLRDVVDECESIVLQEYDGPTNLVI